MSDRIKWPPLSKHGIEANGRIISLEENLSMCLLTYSIHRQYHTQIQKRVAPILKTIAKNRKKKEQEALANATKLTEVQEEQINDIPQPTVDRITTPLPVKGNL